jgi:hypothetical protein
MPADDERIASFEKYGVMTDPGRYAALLERLPADVEGLTGVAHGLLIHEYMTGGYGVTAPEGDHPTVHIRPVEQLLGEIVALDSRPLTQARPPKRRVLGNCRHFTVLMTTMLRAQGIPARARCGFGNYFGTGWSEDHWVGEYEGVGVSLPVTLSPRAQGHHTRSDGLSRCRNVGRVTLRLAGAALRGCLRQRRGRQRRGASVLRLLHREAHPGYRRAIGSGGSTGLPRRRSCRQ